MKRILVSLYFLVIALIGVSTLLGETFAERHIYGAGWFCALWAALAAFLTAAVIRKKLLRRLPLLLLHGAFLVILAGALSTYLTSRKGVAHLLPGVPVNTFQTAAGQEDGKLPFSLRLDSFSVKCYPGTEAPADYVSCLTVIEDGKPAAAERVSMNRILRRSGYRFYQSSYDEDGAGSWLTVNYDPWGTGVTYFGYLLLALGMLAVLFDRRGEFRALLRHPLLRGGGLSLALLFLLCGAQPARASRSLPAFSRERADSLALRQVVYNDRIAPFNTLARDFLLKIHGRASYGGLTPEQVVTGWLFRPDVWQNEPMILVKNARLRGLLGIEGKYARFTDLFRDGNYLLQRYWRGGAGETAAPADPLQKAIMETDEKVGLIMMLEKGTLIRPLPRDGSVRPLSPLRVQAEVLYNRLPLTRALFIANLALGFLAFGRMVWRSLRGKPQSRAERVGLPLLLGLSALALLFSFSLRWFVAGHVPLSNGFETMQFMALVTLLIALALHRRFGVLLPFGFILSGFALLVSHLGQSDPQVTNLMPVLASPWLSLHVSVVMMGYSLLAFVMLTGVLGLCVRGKKEEELMLLGRLLLYPAVFFLGAGIFLGAVWANQSWGSYWSWDPKEVWALVAFMTYGVGFHAQSLPWLRRPRHFHLFSVLAFLTVLMTYFGVNFFLGGMHSYAG